MQLVSALVSAHTGRAPQGIGGETRCNRRERETREGKACPNFATPPAAANWVGVGRSDAIMMARSEGGVSKGREDRGGQIAPLMKRNDGNANNTASAGRRTARDHGRGDDAAPLGDLWHGVMSGLYASDSDRTSYHFRAAKEAIARSLEATVQAKCQRLTQIVMYSDLHTEKFDR